MTTPTFEENLRKQIEEIIGLIHIELDEKTGLEAIFGKTKAKEALEQLVNQNYVLKSSVVEALEDEDESDGYGLGKLNEIRNIRNREIRTKLLGKETKGTD